jgi:YqaJ-like viral recombinase domain
VIWHDAAQGSPAWLDARRGVVTGSRFRDARDKLKSGKPSGKQIAYAYDVARERVGGKAPEVYVNAAMRFGTENEPLARLAYELATGNVVEEVGFCTDDEGIFGCSPDGIIGSEGVLEIKSIVSSDTLFTAVVDGDYSAYMDQIIGYHWLLGCKWVDLVLFCPDLEEIGLSLTIIRINRDEEAIEALESDLLNFAAQVALNIAKLRQRAAKNPQF